MYSNSTINVPLIINNQEVYTDETFEVRDPGKLSDIVGHVSKATIEHLNNAVEAAHHAFEDWKTTDLKARIQKMEEAAVTIEKNKNTIENILMREQGMLRVDTKMDIERAIKIFRLHAENAESFFKPEYYSDEESWVKVEKVPYGVVAAIIPWNAPINLTIAKLAPALLAGNTIIVKPSPFAPVAVTFILKEIAKLFPNGVINVIHGEGKIGSELVNHRFVRKISFTGGVKTGSLIMESAAKGIKHINLELGGNDPAIVLEDVDIEKTIPKIVRCVFRRSGQVCFAIKRIYVQETIFNRFYESMCEYVNEFVVGHSLHPETTFAPLNNKLQYDNVTSLIERTKASNATVKQLGKKLDPSQWDNGYYILPTIVKDLEPNQELITCEQFGPVIPLIPFTTDSEVIKSANNTEFGLGASVWSNDIDRAEKIIHQVDAGITFINNHTQTSLGLKHMPFGGVKQSGLGWEHTKVGMAEYIQYKSINSVKE